MQNRNAAFVISLIISYVENNFFALMSCLLNRNHSNIIFENSASHRIETVEKNILV